MKSLVVMSILLLTSALSIHSTAAMGSLLACDDLTRRIQTIVPCDLKHDGYQSYLPAITIAPPKSNTDLGIAAYMEDSGQSASAVLATRRLGFGWIKQEVDWREFETFPGVVDFDALDRIVNVSDTAGIRLLFSVASAPSWAREPGHDSSVDGPPLDPATYAAFVGALAARYCDASLKAIEVWNGQNLHYQWGNRPLNSEEYVQLLAVASASIKAACPSMYVVSGALYPAGNNIPYAMDDFVYLEHMLRAGANAYFDALGVNAPGYNVPPNVTWENACTAIQQYGNSFNGACENPHHSWSFRSTMEGNRNIMNVYSAGNKMVWVTEFGWAAGGAISPLYSYANDNDFDEQATWTVEAFQMMLNWEWVGPAFLYNLNARVISPDQPKSMWGIVGPNWEPLPVFRSLSEMPR